jgi:hypothetical protein
MTRFLRRPVPLRISAAALGVGSVAAVGTLLVILLVGRLSDARRTVVPTRPALAVAAMTPLPSPTPAPTATPAPPRPAPSPHDALPRTLPPMSSSMGYWDHVNALPAPVSSTAGPSGAWIALSPDHGPPGTVVEIEGYVPVRPSNPQDTGTVCWRSCLTGLSEGGATISWSSEAGHFATRFTVPTVPWLEADGPHRLVPGDYPISVACVGGGACFGSEGQAAATFHLTAPGSSLCASGPCGWLRLDPPEGQPGTVVQVHGWAPLFRFNEYELFFEGVPPSAAYLWMCQIRQAPDGTFSCSFRVPAAVPSREPLTPGTYTIVLHAWFLGVSSPPTPVDPSVQIMQEIVGEGVFLAPTPFRVATVPTWASLGQIRPLAIERSVDVTWGATFDATPDGRAIAYCSEGGIHVSRDGGATWSVIPTRAAAVAAAATDHPIPAAPGTNPICWSATLDPSHPARYYAVFLAGASRGGPSPDPLAVLPPILVGYATGDSGKTWGPAPEAEGGGRFGGFAAGKGGVRALYGSFVPEQLPVVSGVEQTADGGRTWTPARPTCPSVGPCVRWGPGPDRLPNPRAQYYPGQLLEVSADGGTTWRPPDWLPEVGLWHNLGELAPLDSRQILLVDGNDEWQYPLSISRDGGRTWRAITLPSLPGSDGVNYVFPGLQLLSNGALLARLGDHQPWLLLPPAADRWCKVAERLLPATADNFLSASGRIWWLDTSDEGVPARLQSLPLDAIRCSSPPP